MERKVWALRRDFPFMGKRKLRVLLLREDIDLSESTVGRILAKGVRRGLIQPCAFCRGRTKIKSRGASTATPGACPGGKSPNSPANSFRSTTCPPPATASD